jgi:hypothetical protein
MSFTDDQLKVLVREGKYSDPAAEEYLLAVLEERRDMTGRYWFSRVSCLDDFVINDLAEGIQEIRFADLGINGKLWSERETRYRYDLRIAGRSINENIILGGENVVPLTRVMDLARSSGRLERPLRVRDQWELTLTVSRDFGQTWGKWVKLYLIRNPDTGRFTLLGSRRED